MSNFGTCSIGTALLNLWQADDAAHYLKTNAKLKAAERRRTTYL